MPHDATCCKYHPVRLTRCPGGRGAYSKAKVSDKRVIKEKFIVPNTRRDMPKPPPRPTAADHAAEDQKRGELPTSGVLDPEDSWLFRKLGERLSKGLCCLQRGLAARQQGRIC